LAIAAPPCTLTIAASTAGTGGTAAGLGSVRSMARGERNDRAAPAPADGDATTTMTEGSDGGAMHGVAVESTGDAVIAER